MRNQRLLVTQLMMLTFRFFLYALLFASFFYFLSINNPQIINLSRTAATTMATFAVIMAILTFVYGGYEIGVKKYRTVFSSVLLSTLFADIVTYLQLQIMNVNPANNDRLILFGDDLPYLLIALAMQVGTIYFFVTVGYHFYFRLNPPQRCCVITSSQELANHVARKISGNKQRFRLCDVAHYECPDVLDAIRRHEVIFLAGIPDTEEGQLQNFCYRLNKSIYLLAELEDVIISTAEQSILEDTPFLHIHRVVPTLMQLFTKRLMDIVISLLGLILTSPFMLAAAASIWLTGGKPIFFRQKRATIDGKIFEIIKFRTMYRTDTGDAPAVSARTHDARITPLGRVLRNYRIDELPQLFNVLRGDMSIVGPRPEMLENVEKYEQEVPEFRYRLQMKAGLTGLAQIDGKYNTSPKDKAILDLLYIENFSIPMDLKLIMRTLTVFFRRDSTEGFASARKGSPLKMRTEALPVEVPAPPEPTKARKPMSAAKKEKRKRTEDAALRQAPSPPISPGEAPSVPSAAKPEAAELSGTEEAVRAAL